MHEASDELQAWQARIDAAGRKWEKALEAIDDSRDYAAGVSKDGKTDVPTNIILATNQGLLPHIYARNPDVSVRPAERAGQFPGMYESVRRFSETAQIVLAKEIEDAGLKRIAKAVIRAVQTSRVGIVKVSYQKDIYTDPEVAQRINDTQDNVAKLRQLIADLDGDGQDSSAQALQLAELEQIILGLEENLEVTVARGLTFSRIDIKDFRMDTGVDSLYDYTCARWMAHRSWRSPDDVKAKYGVSDEDIGEIQHYKREKEGYTEADAADREADYVCVWEAWDHATNSVWTWAEGGKDWLREPYRPTALGKRWFPFFILGHHWIDGNDWPLSDVEQLRFLQDEYTQTREQQRKHREMSRPYMLFDSGLIDGKNIANIVTVGDKEFVGVEANGHPLGQAFMPGPTVPMNPAVYDTSPIRADIDWVSGVPDAARGAIMRAKTATEAGMMQAGMASRVSERQDETEDWLTDIFEYSLQILLQEIDSDEAMRVAGPNAYWPDVQDNKALIYDLVDVDVRAGSTAKPDKLLEQENWTALLPQIQQLVGQAMQLRMAGIPDKSNPFVQILEITLKRFDERTDIEQILPPMDMPQQQQVTQPTQPQQPMQ